MGLENIRLQGQQSLFDVIGFSNSDPIYTNLAIVNGAIAHSHEASEQLKVYQVKLQAYIGIKAKYFEVKVLMRDDYSRKVAVNDQVVESELRQMSGMKEKYQNAFSEYG